MALPRGAAAALLALAALLAALCAAASAPGGGGVYREVYEASRGVGEAYTHGYKASALEEAVEEVNRALAALDRGEAPDAAGLEAALAALEGVASSYKEGWPLTALAAYAPLAPAALAPLVYAALRAAPCIAWYLERRGWRVARRGEGEDRR